jgi:hypothetical protein
MKGMSMAKKLVEIARILRSKNAGPLFITFDVIFDTHEDLKNVLSSKAIDEAVVASLYGVDAQDVSIIPYEVVNAFKITIPRTHVSGDLEDDDIYGCQQHLKLANILIP